MAALLVSLRLRPRSLYNVSSLRICLSEIKKPARTVGTFSFVQRNHCVTSKSRSILKPKLITSGRRDFHGSVVCYEVVTVNAPPFAESVTEGDVRWEKAVGDAVEEDEVVGEIETDKTSIPLMAPSAGVVSELLAGDGDTVTAGMALFKLDTSGAAPAAKPAPAPEAAAPPPPEPAAAAAPPPAAAPSTGAGPIPTTPPPVPPVPTQPLAVTPTSAIKPTSPPPAVAPSGGEGVVLAGARTETRVKMNRMRLRIANRLKEAQNTCAMLTTFNEIDMSNIMEMRKQYQDQFVKRHGIKVGFMSAFVKAAAYALQSQPVVNAVIDENEIMYRDYVDISVAVATPKGLVVPVIRNADTLDYAGIEKYIADLGEKARSNTLAVEDMDGGTFTISNGGVFGSMFGTPIINPPQSAILGMHAIFDRPMSVGGGKIEVRPMMYVALTYDHRLIDGRDAVTFLKTIKSAVEDPRTLLLGL